MEKNTQALGSGLNDGLGPPPKRRGNGFRQMCLCDKRCGVDLMENQRDELAALVGKLARKLREAAPGSDLPDKAIDYLQRNNLVSPLRA